MAPGADGDAAFVRRVLIVVAISALAVLLWRLIDLLLVFGAVLVCVLLRAVAEPMARRTQLSDRWALAAASFALLAVVGLAAWLFGAEVRTQVAELADRLPQAWRSFEGRLGVTDLGQRLISRAEDVAPDAGSVVSGLAGVVTSFVGGLADFLLIVFGGVYLAAQPDLYRRGVLLLLPPRDSRKRLADSLHASGAALRLWLLGQVVAMLFVFVLTVVGLWAIGVPAALAPALLAGLAEFVPLIGPIVAAIPALLIALSEGWQIALWTLLLYVAIQQVESNIITPLVQRQAVELPPAVTLPVRRGRLRPPVRAARRPVRHAARRGRLRRRQEAVGARGAGRADRGARRVIAKPASNVRRAYRAYAARLPLWRAQKINASTPITTSNPI